MRFLEKILILSAVALVAAALPSKAQFQTTGTDPSNVKWMVRKTPHYRIIYPSQGDSLALTYARSLERFYPLVGNSTGYLPGEMYRAKTPVILHLWNTESNGSVVWAPKRMEFYTTPDPYNPEPLFWSDNLSVHESRHLSQMQFGYDGLLRPFNYLFGEAAQGAFAGVYPSTHLLEGDAVVAETGLTRFGRGRRAEFLQYYMAAADAGDTRSWYSWRYGSYRHYTPDHYALGYLTIAGVRTLYDDPLFMSRYFHNVTSRPLRLGNLQRTVRQASGKSFKATFSDIMNSEHARWASDAELRKPYLSAEPVTRDSSWFFSYTGTVAAGGSLYSIRSGLSRENNLVRISPDGEVKALRPFSYYASKLASSEGRIWWSESVPSARREQKICSDIKYLTLGDNKIHSFTKGRRFYNPCPSPSGNIVAVTEYPAEGGSALVLLDGENGTVLKRTPAPDGLQLVESSIVRLKDGEVIFFVSGISKEGSSIYRLDDKGDFIDCLGGAQPVSVSCLRSRGEELVFVCDRTGVNEVYSLSVGGYLRQLTSSRYGGTDFTFSSDTLYFSSLSDKGRFVYSTPTNSLMGKEVSFSDIHSYPMADKLSEQEKALASAQKGTPASPADESYLTDSVNVEVSAPEKYSKAAHLFHAHSWVPVYVNPEAVNDLSFDDTSNDGGLGATLFFQNELGTLHGAAAYEWAQDEDDKGWRHSGHLALTYEGLFPVISFSLHYGERQAVQYFRRVIERRGTSRERVEYTTLDIPLLKGELQAWIPFNFSSSGWSRGVIPSVQWSFSNDRYSKSEVDLSYDGGVGDFTPPGSFSLYKEDDNVLIQTIDGRVRAYATTYVPSSAVYPRIGIGAEVGYETRLSLSSLYTSDLYGYAYGYLPGLFPCQGLRWTAAVQKQISSGNKIGRNKLTMRPRGFAGTQVSNILSTYAPSQYKLTADYAIPVWIGDWSGISPIAYIKNLILKPHAEVMYAELDNGLGSGNLWSVGTEFDFRLGNLLWLPYEATIGVSYSRNGGSLYNLFRTADTSIGRNYLGLVFNLNL